VTNFHNGAILQHFVRTRDCKAVPPPLPLPECVLLDVDVVVPPPPEELDEEDDVLEEAADTVEE